MGANISQHYRKSLQPYVDPEILEGVDYLPATPETIGNSTSVTARSNSQGTKFLILVLTGLCLVGLSYNHAANFTQKQPFFPVMSHSAN